MTDLTSSLTDDSVGSTRLFVSEGGNPPAMQGRSFVGHVFGSTMVGYPLTLKVPVGFPRQMMACLLNVMLN